jgi:hypothetical protein
MLRRDRARPPGARPRQSRHWRPRVLINPTGDSEIRWPAGRCQTDRPQDRRHLRRSESAWRRWRSAARTHPKGRPFGRVRDTVVAKNAVAAESSDHLRGAGRLRGGKRRLPVGLYVESFGTAHVTTGRP